MDDSLWGWVTDLDKKFCTDYIKVSTNVKKNGPKYIMYIRNKSTVLFQIEYSTLTLEDIIYLYLYMQYLIKKNNNKY